MGDLASLGTRARERVTPPSLRELALEEIRLAITTGQMDEGRIYSAAGLAKQLGMSLSPVREAMMSLVSEGTVEAIANRGFRLRPIDRDDLDEIIRIRLLLSMPAVADICARVTQAREGQISQESAATLHAQLQELRELAEGGVAAIDAAEPETFTKLDREFHRRLLEFGLGRRAADISIKLRDQSRLAGLGRPTFTATRRTAHDLTEIVELLTTGQTQAAQDLVQRNLFHYRHDDPETDSAPEALRR